MSLQCKKRILAFGMNRMNSKAAVFRSLAKKTQPIINMKLFMRQVHSGNTSWKAPRGLPRSGLLPGKGSIAIVMVLYFWLCASSESKHIHTWSRGLGEVLKTRFDESFSPLRLDIHPAPQMFSIFYPFLFLWFWEVELCLLDANYYITCVYIYIFTYIL